MNAIKYNLIPLLFYATFFFVGGCGDIALFDELSNNRVKVVIKGTYESNDPRQWWDGADIDTINLTDNESVDDCTNPSEDSNPTSLMLDIANLKIIDLTGKHQQPFANYRRTFIFGLDDGNPFFNGLGILYKNDDMRPNFPWAYIQMFIRKIIFNNAVEYYLANDGNNFNGEGEWNFSKNIDVLFHEDTVYGFNINTIQINTYYDSLLELSPYINRVFPLHIPIEDGFHFDSFQNETILEIRLVVKNYLKKYEYDYTENDIYYVQHYYAFSDWLRDIREDEIVIGGNLISVARFYTYGMTVNLTGNAGSNNCYVCAIATNHTIGEYEPGDRRRPGCDGRGGCDEPKEPNPPVPDDLVSILDYYLKYERYKDDYNDFIDCVDSGDYEEEWNDYDDEHSGFKIPPIATWAGDGGDYVLTNVPIGKTYNIYRSNDGNGIGELPYNFVNIGTVTVSADQVGQTLNVK